MHPDGQATRLELVWSETSRRTQGFLRSRGVPANEAEELAQEVAVRALRSGVAFESADDLVPWACTVAWRLRVSHLRRLQARAQESELVDVVSVLTVEDEAISRVEARHVFDAIGSLSQRDQTALLETLVGPGAAQDARAMARSAVARHRARARLLRALGGSISGGVAWFVHRARWLAPATAVAATLSVVLLVPPDGPAERPPVAPATAQPTVAATRPVGTVPAGGAAPTPVARRPTPTTAPPGPPTRAPSKVVLVVQTDGGPQLARVERRTGKATDHLLCTGSLIVLPHLCIG